MLWDRFIRLFHWSLVSGIALNYWVLEGGDPPHEWLGYALGALVLARIAWGFVGSPPARFAHFVCGGAAYCQRGGYSVLSEGAADPVDAVEATGVTPHSPHKKRLNKSG